MSTPTPPSFSPSPSPPPQRPAAVTPGIRAAALSTLYTTTLQATLKTISYPSFASCFPTIATKSPTNLQLMHTTMLTRLSTFAHNEFEQILRERNVVELLNRLEELLADARRRRGREVDGEKEEDVVPPHLLPAPAIAAAHLSPLYQSQQSQLNAKLQTVQSQNAMLAETLEKQREEIELLIGGVETVVKDLEGASALLDAQADLLSKDARAADGAIMEI